MTDGTGQTHLLFLDQSTLTVGPNAEVLIDEQLAFFAERAPGANARRAFARLTQVPSSRARGLRVRAACDNVLALTPHPRPAPRPSARVVCAPRRWRCC